MAEWGSGSDPALIRPGVACLLSGERAVLCCDRGAEAELCLAGCVGGREFVGGVKGVEGCGGFVDVGNRQRHRPNRPPSATVPRPGQIPAHL